VPKQAANLQKDEPIRYYPLQQRKKVLDKRLIVSIAQLY